MTHQHTDRLDALRPFLSVLDGTPVPLADLVAGGEGWPRFWSLAAGPSPGAPTTTGQVCGARSASRMRRRRPGDSGSP